MIVSTIRPKAGVTFCSAKSLSAALESANNILKISFALANGLSLCSETHPILHGSKVAYGVLVQLAYTGDTSEIEKLLPFYQPNH